MCKVGAFSLLLTVAGPLDSVVLATKVMVYNRDLWVSLTYTATDAARSMDYAYAEGVFVDTLAKNARIVRRERIFLQKIRRS
jgi:hypothetical protein